MLLFLRYVASSIVATAKASDSLSKCATSRIPCPYASDLIIDITLDSGENFFISDRLLIKLFLLIKIDPFI